MLWGVQGLTSGQGGGSVRTCEVWTITTTTAATARIPDIRTT